ncbi:2-amino-4-hydroxy-6-hydroxymethyldihydropteridine diphosphokinase [Tumidithrix elongata RA019]|uniref:2-amino-4-hydroxy-6-hydroxymethyldihydropteridine diphosphokinase n=1 Tax=Tumidithrix elongata BACA0141 TaxID=2716417 RepID=A0AAW9PQ85_9CYAN|nr:2-amino-4-hydroxy-6-hydroxymethyldihydropteridine diphosphokinase [Tumidithrix elongata RA019]
MPSLCAIALGSNLGDSSATVNAALDRLHASPQVHIVRRSRWYRTKAITMPDSPPQADYINGCAILSTDLTPYALLQFLLDTEIQFGRERRERWGARTLDLDLLLYGDRILDTANLVVPHPRMCDRAFVLIPLAEIAPDWIHPINGCAIAKLALDPPDLPFSCPEPIEHLP